MFLCCELRKNHHYHTRRERDGECYARIPEERVAQEVIYEKDHCIYGKV